MADVFLSWGSPDAVAVRKLSARLRANGLDCFEYSEDMKAAALISEQINSELNAARVVVFCVSDQMLERPWVTKELNWCEKARLDRAEKMPPGTLEIVPVQVGARAGHLPPLLQDRFTVDLSIPASFETNLERLVAGIRERLGLVAPIVVPAAILAFSQTQFGNLTPAGKQKLEPLCRKVGMRPSPELEELLGNRYGADPLDFRPFPDGSLRSQVDEAVRLANRTRAREQRAPVWLWWCNEELFSKDRAVRDIARERWRSLFSLLIVDSLSLSIKKEELQNQDATPDLLQECLKLASYANLANTALLWVPPYTGHTAELESIIDEHHHRVESKQVIIHVGPHGLRGSPRTSPWLALPRRTATPANWRTGSSSGPHPYRTATSSAASRAQSPERHFRHALVLGDEHRLEPSLEARPAPPMRPVEAAAVTDLQPPDRIAQICLPRPEQEVVVVVPQDQGRSSRSNRPGSSPTRPRNRRRSVSSRNTGPRRCSRLSA